MPPSLSCSSCPSPDSRSSSTTSSPSSTENYCVGGNCENLCLQKSQKRLSPVASSSKLSSSSSSYSSCSLSERELVLAVSYSDSIPADVGEFSVKLCSENCSMESGRKRKQLIRKLIRQGSDFRLNFRDFHDISNDGRPDRVHAAVELSRKLHK